MPRVVFMGSPAFAVPSLRALAEMTDVVGVVTQPDRPAGRGRKPAPSAVKLAALELNLPLIEPQHLRDAYSQLQTWQPDLIAVVAYGQILRANVLSLPPRGCLNVHASLLPRHRGAAPVQAAILAGDSETGVTLMKMDAGLDTGPILAQRPTTIMPAETATQLAARLAALGADLLRDSLPAYWAGDLKPAPQDERLATYAPQLNKEDGLLRFSGGVSVEDLERRVRAMADWPGAFVRFNDQPIKILRAHARHDVQCPPGRVAKIGGQPAIGAPDGALVLELIQPPGRKPMPAAAYLNGNPAFVGAQLG